MGIFHASATDPAQAKAKFQDALREDETVLFAFKTIRDYFLFTEKRLLSINPQGMTGSKIEFASVPYRAINIFVLETAGTFDLDCEVKFVISGRSAPLEFKLSRGSDVRGLQRFLADRLL